MRANCANCSKPKCGTCKGCTIRNKRCLQRKCAQYEAENCGPKRFTYCPNCRYPFTNLRNLRRHQELCKAVQSDPRKKVARDMKCGVCQVAPVSKERRNVVYNVVQN